jgi:hypothetical protein
MEKAPESLMVRMYPGVWTGQWYYEIIETKTGIKVAYNKYPLPFSEAFDEVTNHAKNRAQGCKRQAWRK